MNKVISEIQADIDWRISEIATIKSITVDLSLSEHKKAAARKYSIPAFYAVWESFVVKSFETYIIFLNSLEMSFTNINSHILTHNSYACLSLANPPQNNIDKKKEFISKIYNYIKNKIKISTDISTHSNVDFKCLTEICYRYKVYTLDRETFEGELNKFVNLRNKIAHGDNSVIINQEYVDSVSELIIKAMDSLCENIENAMNNEEYIKEPIV